MNPELIKAQINQAIITQNNEQLRQYAHTLKTAILETDELLEQYFEILLDLLTNDNLLNLESAWDFFFVLKNCRDFFNEEQKKFYEPSLETIYKTFDDINLEQVKADIKSIIATGNGKELKLIASAIDKSMFGMDHFSNHFFEFLISILNQNNFLDLEGSWHLLMVFITNSELLSEQQKHELISVIKIRFNQFKDWMSQFLLVELLGDYLANENTLETFCYLKEITDDESRCYIPHGLEFLTKKLTDKNLAKKTINELLQMRNDPSEKVRYEVNLSLQNLKNQGYIV